MEEFLWKFFFNMIENFQLFVNFLIDILNES